MDYLCGDFYHRYDKINNPIYYVFLMFLHTYYKMKWSKIVYVVDKIVKNKALLNNISFFV